MAPRSLISIFVFCAAALSSGSGESLRAQTALGTPDIEDIEYPMDEAPESAEIELGKILFFDARLSNNQKQSCASCHNPDLGFGDGLAFGLGSEGESLTRNTPHIFNLAWASTFFWDGRALSLEEQALGPIQSAGEMNMSLELLLPRLQAVAEYRQRFRLVYGSESITAERIAMAIAAFERTIVSDNSAFDQYISGNKRAMSVEAIRGLNLFQGKANCTQCHDGANFTDDSFHNIGVDDDDPGRALLVGDDSLMGAFKTPGLRNVSLTAPYMHDGSQASLEAVIRFYNNGGDKSKGRDELIKVLKLSDQEILDLVAFLGALTDPVTIKRPIIP